MISLPRVWLSSRSRCGHDSPKVHIARVTTPILLFVLFAAFLHALWNALLKKGNDPVVDTAAIWAGSALSVAPFLFVLPLPARETWWLLSGSIVVHLAYYFTLVQAYKRGALSAVYPIMRGVAPVFVTLVSLAGFGEPLRSAHVFAIALICAGVLAVSGVWQRRAGMSSATFAFAVLTALLVAAYTLIDGQGARRAGNALSYLVWLAFLQGVLVLGIAATLRRNALAATWAGVNKKTAVLGGAASSGAYAITLWAMTHAPVALVAALREVSVLFATLLGAWMLKERVSWQRWLGAGLVVVGVVMLRVG
jgi:drug/metabolite transporter (DMT)-like permease